jgi:hypothetical protein
MNQPHSPSPHFSSFPTWTPRLSLYGSIFYLHLRSIMNPPFHPQSICPSAHLSSFHLPHTENHQWGPHPSLVLQKNFCPPWGAHFIPGHPFMYLYISPQIIHYLLYKCLYFQSLHFLLSSPLATCFLLATHNPCHPWLEHYLSSTLSGIIHIFRVLHRSFTSTL